MTAIHAGLVAATFWALLGNAVVSTQVVEDGTLSSLIVSHTSLLEYDGCGAMSAEALFGAARNRCGGSNSYIAKTVCTGALP